MTYKEKAAINKGSKVKSIKKTDVYGYSILEGTVLEVVAADYEDDFTLYKLKEVAEKEQAEKAKEFWVYGFNLVLA